MQLKSMYLRRRNVQVENVKPQHGRDGELGGPIRKPCCISDVYDLSVDL